MNFDDLDMLVRLEPTRDLDDLPAGFASPVADPLWLLGRQWQLGEHLGEDAASPVRVHYARQVRHVVLPDDPAPAGARTPPEAAIEAEPDQWWTPARRIRIGRRVARLAEEEGRGLPDDETLLLTALPEPYAHLDGGPDGRALWVEQRRLGLRRDWFVPTPPPPRDDAWDPARFRYDARLEAEELSLELVGHEGGRLDWWSVDASGPHTDVVQSEHLDVLCSRLRYPGAPTPRWWQIDPRTMDIGGQPPSRAHLGTLLAADLLSSHSDDWYTFPITAPSGAVVTVFSAWVTDSFDEEHWLSPPDDWSLFAVTGLGPSSVLLWPAVTNPLTGPLLDEVLVGIDEDAQLLWAVEQRAAGRELATSPRPPGAPPEAFDARAEVRPTYHAAPEVPRHWHPYVLDDDPKELRGSGRSAESIPRRFVQGRLTDSSGEVTELSPAPVVDLLADRSADPSAGDPVHWIDPGVVPRDGLRLHRHMVLARRTDGSPVLWSERRRAAPAASPAFAPIYDRIDDRR